MTRKGKHRKRETGPVETVERPGHLARLPRPKVPTRAIRLAAVPLAIVLSLAAYVLSGRSSQVTVSTNYVPAGAFLFETIPVESYPGPASSAFELTYALTAESGRGLWTVPKGSRLLLQVDTAGRSLVFRIEEEREGAPPDVRTARVSDREWIDVGPIPDGLQPTRIALRSESGRPFSLRIPMAMQPGDLREVSARPLDFGSPKGTSGFTPRYRIVHEKAVPPLETIRRLLFFPSASRLLLLGLVLGLGAVLAGALLVRRGVAAGVFLAVTGVALTHATLRPPLRGEDETTHVATVEAVVWQTGAVYGTLPKSIDRVVAATRLGMNQFDTTEVLPVTTPAERTAIRELLAEPYADEATMLGGKTPLAGIQAIGQRGRLYYPLFSPGRAPLMSMGILDRFSAYRLLSTLLAVALFGGGLALLRIARLPNQLLLLYGLVALVPPYLMSLVTTVSNYSMAIGIGCLLSAAVVTAVLSERSAARIIAGGVLVVGAAVGIAVWADFVMFLPVSLAALAVVVVVSAFRCVRRLSPRRAWVAVVLGLSALAGAAFLARDRFGFWAREVAPFFRDPLSRRPKGFPPPGDPVWLDIARVVAIPALFATLLVLFGLLDRRLKPETRDRLAAARSAAGLAVFVVLFLVTPFAVVPTDVRLGFVDEVRAHWNAFFSTAFSLTQDTLSWKMYWGVFGWADVKYPDVVYAAAKALCIGLFVSLPLLCRRFTRERPAASAALLLVSGLVVSFAVATNTLRYFHPNNPWGRYILPWVPIALFAALARMDRDERREEVLRWVFVGAVCFHLWTAIAVVGGRYFIPR